MKKAPREGFHSVTPRIVVTDVEGQVAFLRAVFRGSGDHHPGRPTYRLALAAGGVSIEEPLDTPYGDRRGMVRDPWGNVWQISHVLSGR
jgi:hypothetical protein